MRMLTVNDDYWSDLDIEEDKGSSVSVSAEKVFKRFKFPLTSSTKCFRQKPVSNLHQILLLFF